MSLGEEGKSSSQKVQFEKALTLVLRHKAEKLKLNIAPDGYVAVDDLQNLKWPQFAGSTLEDFVSITQNSDKKRFQMKEEQGRQYIRCVQGHSILSVKDNLLLQPLSLQDPNLPKVCVHGTYMKFFDSIMEKGLLAGGMKGNGTRKHVHFAPFEPGDKSVISGMRYDCNMAIWLNLRKALQEGMKLHTSENQVILTPGLHGVVPVRFFEKVKDLRNGKTIWSQRQQMPHGQQKQSNQAQNEIRKRKRDSDQVQEVISVKKTKLDVFRVRK